MDFVKREDNNLLEEESYKIYMENLQKSHQIDTTDYHHNAITMEQLQLAMQSSLNSGGLVHNFQLPISPRQMSTLMLKTNHLTRSLNFNEIPAHLPKSLNELDLINEQLRHEELMNQNLNKNIDLSRPINDLELQNTLHLQHIQEEINRNLNADLSQNVSRDVHGLSDLELNLNRPTDSDVLINQDDLRRSPLQYVESHVLKQHLSQRLEQNLARVDQHALDRLDYSVNQKLDQILAQRFEQSMSQRLDQRLVGMGLGEQRLVEQAENNVFPMPFYIKPEQDDDTYVFYDNINQGINTNAINGDIQGEPSQPNTTNIQPEHLYTVYNNHIPIQALNSLELYQRPPNYIQNYTPSEVVRENPQNLVVNRQYENSSPYAEELKKLRQDVAKVDVSKHEEPKENLRPSDQNKILNYQFYEKNENDSGVTNKISDDPSLNIKGAYICFKCKETFPSKRVLKQHTKSCENGLSVSDLEKLGKFSCTQCAYRCQSPAILKIHERTHSGEKPYACTFCDYKSGQKNNVAKHILVHMKQKPFRCQFCEYRCAQKNNLVVHERTHTGYKPFACPFCDYRTVQKPNLVKHMYLHTDQKPFSCDMCSYRCVQKTNLTKHKQRHLNEKEGEKVELKSQNKPYRPRQKSVKCPYCPYKCVQKSSLEKHVQFKHNDASKSDFSEMGGGNDEVCDTIQNLSVKKDSQFDCVEKNEAPVQA